MLDWNTPLRVVCSSEHKFLSLEIDQPRSSKPACLTWGGGGGCCRARFLSRVSDFSVNIFTVLKHM